MVIDPVMVCKGIDTIMAQAVPFLLLSQPALRKEWK